MRIFKKFLRILAILLPCLVGVLLFTNNSHAVSDLTYTFDSNNNTYDFNICGSDLGLSINCSDYKYVIIDASSNSCLDWYPQAGIGFEMDGRTSYTHLCYASYVIYEFDSPLVTWARINPVTDSVGFNSGWSVVVTVTDTLPSGGSESEPCPEVPENPYDTKLDDIKKAIYICGASAIMIYFFYIIYGIFIKPTGGQK